MTRAVTPPGTFTFLHAADLHIDSPLRGLERRDNAPVDRLRGATRVAMTRLVDLAIGRGVDFVVLAGDLFDGDWTDFRTGLFFREQMVRLSRASIRVFIARGNHDAESRITRQVPEVPGVHVLRADEAETVHWPERGVAIHGRSFGQRVVDTDLVDRYPPAVPGCFNLGMLHTSLGGSVEHDTYAPTSVSGLTARGYDYFALGHIHERRVVQPAHPRIVFPGNLQGRHARETGPKGCEWVQVRDFRIERTEFVALDCVRWHRIDIDLAGASDAHDVRQRFLERVRPTLRQGTDDAWRGGRLHVLRVRATGVTPLATQEAAQPGWIAALVESAIQDELMPGAPSGHGGTAAGPDSGTPDEDALWVESVRAELHLPVERASALQRDDAVGELLRLHDELVCSPERLRQWVLDRLDTAQRPALPPDLADADVSRWDDAALRRMLDDAESTVLAQIRLHEARPSAPSTTGARAVTGSRGT